MKLTIALEARFFSTPDGRVWSESVPDYSFWQRYLEVFNSVEIVARVREVPSVPSGYLAADGAGVRFIALPYYLGPYQYLRQAWRIEEMARAAVAEAQAVILRTPGQVSSRLFRYLQAHGHPFAVEVVGDPHDVFAPGSVEHPLRRFFRWLGVRQLKRQCLCAVAASYVTEHTLQRRYPSPAFRVGISDVEIIGAISCSPREHFGSDGIFTIGFVGSLAQLYKAPDVLIDAVALCRTKGRDLKLRLIGDGKFRPLLEEQVKRLDLARSVSFAGQLPAGAAVQNELMQCDLFILPSRTEGLPRAMIEAMACGLPCIGAAVGGIPELLDADDLVPPGDAVALAEKIEQVVSSQERMRAMSSRNLLRTEAFTKPVLDQRRRQFYQYLSDRTEAWLKESVITT